MINAPRTQKTYNTLALLLLDPQEKPWHARRAKARDFIFAHCC
jgi:hypothetical protein